FFLARDQALGQLADMRPDAWTSRVINCALLIGRDDGSFAWISCGATLSSGERKRGTKRRSQHMRQETNEELRDEADRLLDSGLRKILDDYGELYVIGSYALGLMVWRDLDLHIV